jgi:hypothetical protein
MQSRRPLINSGKKSSSSASPSLRRNVPVRERQTQRLAAFTQSYPPGPSSSAVTTRAAARQLLARPDESDSETSEEEWGQRLIDNLEDILGIDLDGNGTSGSGHGLMDVAKAGEKGLVNYLEDATGLDIDGECHKNGESLL